MTGQTAFNRHTSWHRPGLGVVLAGALLLSLSGTAQAESLFRASAVHQDDRGPIVSRSLFTPPISRQVGDIVTIQINEKNIMNTQAELKINRAQAIGSDNAGTINMVTRFIVDKLPFKRGKETLTNKLSVPSLAGSESNNTFNSKAQGTRSRTLQDQIACQVVQVLPNGDLIVQGQKTVMMNKEREELIVTGIVRPYYLDRDNRISSDRVANFQMMQGGKGVISRQQNDGLVNKIHQFLN